MPAFRDLTGETIGKLKVLKYIGRYKHGGSMWLCQCLVCGREFESRVSDVRTGRSCSIQCGILSTAEKNTKHGLYAGRARPRLAGIWRGIKARCLDPRCAVYGNYGGRGIKMHEPWVKDVKAFYDYVSALPGAEDTSLSLDRIDNDGHYEPGNLRWATKKEQGLNRRDNVRLTHKGRTLTLSEWSEETGLGRTFIDRYYAGVRGYDLFDAPKRGYNKLYEFEGRVGTLREWQKWWGISYPSVHNRMTRGLLKLVDS